MAANNDKDDEILYTETYQPFFFFPYSVTVTKTHISFGYYFWLFTKTVDLSSSSTVIKIKAEPIEHVNGLREWGGWGIRLRRHDGHWETGYIAKNGKAVHIIVVTEQQGDAEPSSSYYAFNCSNPQKVCDLINNVAAVKK